MTHTLPNLDDIPPPFDKVKMIKDYKTKHGCGLMEARTAVNTAMELANSENARLMASAPLLYEYVMKCSLNGCEEAKTMLASLHLTK